VLLEHVPRSASGPGNFLFDFGVVQRAIRGVNHCGFTPTELVTAFSDLVLWVEAGVVPEGDVVPDPAAVADPEYGCRFTDLATPGGHILATPCQAG
jgi:hypothetical protein